MRKRLRIAIIVGIIVIGIAGGGLIAVYREYMAGVDRSIAEISLIRNDTNADVATLRDSEDTTDQVISLDDAPVFLPDESVVAHQVTAAPDSIKGEESVRSDFFEKLEIRGRFIDFGFEPADRKASQIDTVVLHSSFNNQGGDQYSVYEILKIWERYGVAPHFVIDRRGNILQLVLEHDIAYHAGVSEMKDGRKNVNDFSLGVEIINAEDDTYTQSQYTAVNKLVAYLKKTYPIKYVVGHDAIAPGRKTDPWNFDWKKLE